MKNKVNYYGNTTVYEVWDKDFQRYFKGVSVCRPEDTYDKEIGERIARQKAVIKMYSYHVKACMDAFDKYERMKLLMDYVDKQYLYNHKQWIKAIDRLTNTLNELKNR